MDDGLVTVQGTALMPVGVGSNTYRDNKGVVHEHPGRYRGGHYWPRGRFASHELTAAQLEEVMADEHIELRDESGMPLKPPPALPPEARAEKKVDASARVAALELELQRERQRHTQESILAKQNAERYLAQAVASRDATIRRLREDLKDHGIVESAPDKHEHDYVRKVS